MFNKIFQQTPDNNNIYVIQMAYYDDTRIICVCKGSNIEQKIRNLVCIKIGTWCIDSKYVGDGTIDTDYNCGLINDFFKNFLSVHNM